MSERSAIPALCEGLGFSYGRTDALRGIHLRIEAGTVTALCGPNGSGKSTLLHLITGYRAPREGRALLFGHDAHNLTRQEAAQRCAFVPQRTSASLPFTALEMVLMGRQPYRGLAARDSADDVRRAEEALAEVEVAYLAAKPFDQLSGGEQQLVILARALAQDTPFLILDEPATYLDLRHQRTLFDVLRRLAASGRTVLATFHDLSAAAHWADTVVLLRCGEVAASGPPGEVLTGARLTETYGTPLRVSPPPDLRVAFDSP